MSKSGLGFRLSDAEPEAEAKAAVVQASALAEADVRKLLGRLPPLTAEAGDEKAFAFRDRSRPAPRPGKTVEQAFPPPAGRPPPAATGTGGSLTVTRRAPEGAIPLAPALNISFSKPMIAITSHADLAKTPPPVVLTPQPPGKWRWLGSQTVVFDPELGRFPMSTEYKVEIPSATRAADGSGLARSEVWTFTTPTLTMKEHQPIGGAVELEPIMFAGFDQGIDREALLRTMRVTAGKEPVAVALASDDDVQGNARLASLVHELESKKGEPPRWIAFRAQRPLPKATRIDVTFPEGTPAAEGPRKTPKPQSFSFSTYGPMALRSSRCNWGSSCTPLSPFTLDFSNPIDTASFDKSMVRVTPELVGMKVAVSGNQIVVSGRSKGRTKYLVSVASALKDRFGQSLSQDAQATFDVTRAAPTLFREESPQIVLDPAGGPKLSAFTVNESALRVRLYQVKPEDWGKYIKMRRDWDYEGKETPPPGRLVKNEIIQLKKAPDELVETSIALDPALASGFGQVVLIVEPTIRTSKERWDREWVRQWIQVTKLGLDAFVDGQKLYAWTTSLDAGKAVEGAEVSLLPAPGLGSPAKTGADGVARIDLADAGGKTVVARKGNDLVMLADRYDDDLSLVRRPLADSTRFFTFDDRRMYKPGEEVHVKGFVRTLRGDAGGDLAKTTAKVLNWRANDPRGSKLTEGTAEVDASGGFDFAFTIAKNANLGIGRIELRLDNSGRSGNHTFQIQEFRRPEFEVGVQVSEGPHFVGKHAVATVAATYYAGGGLPAAETAWTVRSHTASFTPPNWSGFAFGKPPEPWWWHTPIQGSDKPDHEEWKARTSAAGEHRLRIDFDAVEPPYPLTLDLEASVTDVNRQQWTARNSLLVHPGDFTVGLRAQRAFVRAGESLPIDAIVTDLDGNVVAGRTVAVTSARLDSEWTPEGMKTKELDIQRCEITSGKEIVRCTLPTKRGGQYAVTAIVTDTFGRKSQSRMFVWVTDEDATPNRDLAKDKIEILADKKTYAPGETAELLLLAPFAPAEGVLTLQRQGIVHFERFTLTKTSQVVRVKLDRTHFPSVIAHVDLVGVAPRDNAAGEPDPSLPKRPAYASGSTKLDVPPAERTLAIKAVPRVAKLDPGGETAVDLEVKDANGRPVQNAVIAVAVADESILALSGAKLPDPIGFFYAPRPADARAFMTRDLVWLPKPVPEHGRIAGGDEEAAPPPKLMRNGAGGLGSAASGRAMVMKEAMKAPGAPPPPPMASPAPAASVAADTTQAEEQTKLNVRKDFSALAAWLPRVTTDAQGRASFKLKLPESVTRYRIMAVGAADENWFGAGESTVTARLPLMVRPSATRFLNYGDRLDFPIVLQNQTDAPIDVAVAARATNAKMLDTGGRRVVVPANDRVEVRVPVAAEKPGTARFQVAAAAGKYGDAATLELPVWTPATTEAFATYGTIDEGTVAQPVRLPNDVVKEFGSLDITTSSTGLQGLTDAVLYLVRYPFDCNEQISSRVIAIAALRDVLGAFKAPDLPKSEVLAESMKADLEKLRGRQHYSGGFSFWGPNYEPYPWVSVHVAHAVQRAKSKGYSVPSELESRSRQFLKNVERWIPSYYTPAARRAIIGYALYVRQRFGDADPARAKALIAEAGGADKLPIEVLGWLLPILGPDASAQNEVQAIRRHLQNRVTETAGAAHFATSYGDGEYVLLHSDRRADGVLLEALIGDQKESDLIPKLVTGLLGHRKAGRWTNTQENAFVLLALDRYFQTYEKATPNFVGRAWLGERLALEQTFQGRSTDRQQVSIPLAVLADLAAPNAGTQPTNVTIQKDGVGRLYYRVGMNYAPSDLRPPPSENGFTVSRVYEAVDNPKEVQRDADGTYRIKAGAKVRVRVSMVAPARRHHVALVDPLPAGLEPMNPSLAVTGTIPEDPNAKLGTKGMPWWWSRTWYEHQNMRDERVEAFTSLLWDGVYDYTYVARATTPGSFIAPPPKAEEMYNPETFGRGSGDRVIVE
jgi:uncharacterized protein YfaS (alpha-2-macroglobulin family)